MGYILYDGHFMEKYIPHVYIFTGLKMIGLVIFLLLKKKKKLTTTE